MNDPKPCIILFETDDPDTVGTKHDLTCDPGRLECWILNAMHDGRKVTITDATDPGDIKAWEKRNKR